MVLVSQGQGRQMAPATYAGTGAIFGTGNIVMLNNPPWQSPSATLAGAASSAFAKLKLQLRNQRIEPKMQRRPERSNNLTMTGMQSTLSAQSNDTACKLFPPKPLVTFKRSRGPPAAPIWSWPARKTISPDQPCAASPAGSSPSSNA